MELIGKILDLDEDLTTKFWSNVRDFLKDKDDISMVVKNKRISI